MSGYYYCTCTCTALSPRGCGGNCRCRRSSFGSTAIAGINQGHHLNPYGSSWHSRYQQYSRSFHYSSSYNGHPHPRAIALTANRFTYVVYPYSTTTRRNDNRRNNSSLNGNGNASTGSHSKKRNKLEEGERQKSSDSQDHDNSTQGTAVITKLSSETHGSSQNAEELELVAGRTRGASTDAASSPLTLMDSETTGDGEAPNRSRLSYAWNIVVSVLQVLFYMFLVYCFLVPSEYLRNLGRPFPRNWNARRRQVNTTENEDEEEYFDDD